MAKKSKIIDEIINENISVEPLEEVMGDRYATYAKYVIQDRAIPDVRDGLKPVQRRIIFTMFKSNNTFNRPTKKCAHTVGAVMGTFHPHGDTSIYEALARMSQDWKVRYPLIDFQGNNGSIDGDAPAAYRYTESRLSELSNELIRDIEKHTVDMQLNFDDTEYEPVVLPSRFPNLLINGAEGIAVALATEIPPHNLREVIEATIYRINHKNATIADLLTFVQGPDFPMGGFIYKSQGLESIYQTGRGRIEVAAKTEIIKNKDEQQIIVTEIPYKVQKNLLVYEIDKIRHSKAIDGILEVRDESEGETIRIVIDIKKGCKTDLILQYLMDKTSLKTGYSANMVAIVDGRPKTLNLLDFIDSYISHQVDVITRKTNFDLQKYKERLHIVNGLILASININEVVEIIRHSNDKGDSKINLMNRFNLSNEQAEAIVTMPLYKLSHTDELVLKEEKAQLELDISECEEILKDPNKLNRSLIKDLKEISNKYGDDRRTEIIEKGEEKKIDKRELILEESTMVAVTYDGYAKRSSIKSYKSSEGSLPGIKDGDKLIAYGEALTTDFVVCFTNQGNYFSIPVHVLQEVRWKDEGNHLNDFINLNQGEKIIKALSVHEIRNDIYLSILTKFGQIKRMSLASIDTLKHSRPMRCMRLLNNDTVVGVDVLTGNSDLLVITSNGNLSMYNENELTILGSGAGGVKSISGLGSNSAVALIAVSENERCKIALFTDKGHLRIFDPKNINKTARLGKVTHICPSFKGEPHNVVSAIKISKELDSKNVNLYLSNNETVQLLITDFTNTEAQYAKKNINEVPSKVDILNVFDDNLCTINQNTVAVPIRVVEQSIDIKNESSNDAKIENNIETEVEEKQMQSKENEDKKGNGFEQISIFDDIDE
ncbi:MAG: DNA topoisomerase IV subunit A [Bacilli bacterium]|nr:DNA topoisomerase IV subunit A [Bacilli bacterium]